MRASARFSGNGQPGFVAICRPLETFGRILVSLLIDLDADGRMDFVSLIAQEYESVVAFMNRGQGIFEQVILGRAPRPMYGFTGMSLTDLDVPAGSWLNFRDDPSRYSLAGFENDGKQRFTRRGVLTRPTGIVSLALEDVTGDDQVDIVAGVLCLDLMMQMMRGEVPQGTETRMVLLQTTDTAPRWSITQWLPDSQARR